MPIYWYIKKTLAAIFCKFNIVRPMQTPTGIHPAAEWAVGQDFSPTVVDGTITVVLKILDGKCKMLPGEKAAIMEIYDVVRLTRGVLFDSEAHQTIEESWQQEDVDLL